jgi:hypothetical protein
MISGSIDIARDLDICDRGGTGVVNMYGGTINVADDLELPNVADATGTLYMTGGTINITDDLDMLEPGAAKVHLYGGTINVGDDLQLDDPGEFDIGGGALVIDGNAVATVQGFIDNGYIIAYDANGIVLPVDYDPNNGQTTVKALHKFNPIPADESFVTPGTVMLEWTVDAGTIVDVWFADDIEEIYAGSADALVVDKQAVTSKSVTVKGKQRYYWAVDTYAPGADVPVYGHIFSFLADNAPPVVNTGPDVTTWLDNGGVEVTLSGTVDDTDPTTTLWAVVSEPDDPNSPKAVIADPAALETTVTLSAVGGYVLQLQADDGEYQDTDTLTINVYSDPCAAAQSQPGWQPLPGDINLDCVVDQADLDILLEHWQECNGLDCPDIDPIDPNVP